MKSGKLFVISAPSGAGKTTLINRVMQEKPASLNLRKVITNTTRPPRPGEVDGRDYHFHTPDDFRRKQHAGFFLETSQYNGFWYGTPAQIVDDLKVGKSFIVATDRPGATRIKKEVPDAVFIWITVPSTHELERRLIARAQQSANVIAQRLALARTELEAEQREQFFAHHIINDDRERAAAQLLEVIEQSVR